MKVSFSRIAVLPALFILLSACQKADTVSVATLADTGAHTGAQNDSNAEAAMLTVYKSPSCGCCKHWITHVEQHGLSTASMDTLEMDRIKQDYQIRPNYRSCHTGVSQQGYVFEGHVPAKYIKQFLAEAPSNALGLAVPAMPVGSPGMEVEDQFMPYDILLLHADGGSSVYAHIANYQAQF